MKKLACALGALLAGCGGGRLPCDTNFARPGGELAYTTGAATEREGVAAAIPCTAEPLGGGTRYTCQRAPTGAERFTIAFRFVLSAALPTSGEAAIAEPSVYGVDAAVVCAAGASCPGAVSFSEGDSVGSNLRLNVSHAAGARAVTISGPICADPNRSGRGTVGVAFGDVPLAL